VAGLELEATTGSPLCCAVGDNAVAGLGAVAINTSVEVDRRDKIVRSIKKMILR
jgi:hypothetical protein